MYRLYMLIPALIFFMAEKASTQPLTNEGFENWSTQNYFDEPHYWSTFNTFSYLFSDSGYVSKTQDSYQGNFALKLETTVGQFSSFPITLSNQNGQAEGYPFTEKPDSIVFYAKHDISSGDSATIFFQFQNNGNTINATRLSLKGTRNNYQRFSLPIMWQQGIPDPDTLSGRIIGASSSSAINSLTIDSIHFKGATTSFPNGGFENWTNVSSDEPDGMGTFNLFSAVGGKSPMVSKSNNSHSGSFAAKIETQSLSTFNDTLGVMFTGNLESLFGNSSEVPTGIAVNENPQSFSFYYQYDPTGNDSAGIYYAVTSFDQNADSSIIIGENTITLSQQSNYTQQNVQIEYDTSITADSFFIAFTSSNNFIGSSEKSIGSTLLIDDLSVNYQSTSISKGDGLPEVFELYPNPARSTLNLKTEESHEELTLEISNLTGKVVKRVNLPASPASNEHAININNLESGLYIYQLNDQAGNTRQTGKLQVMD